MTIAERFGKRLRKKRLEEGLTQTKLAKKIGCHRVHISNLERGLLSKRAMITLKVASRYGVTL